MLKSELREAIVDTLLDFGVDEHDNEELVDIMIKKISCLDDSFYDDEDSDEEEDGDE